MRDNGDMPPQVVEIIHGNMFLVSLIFLFIEGVVNKVWLTLLYSALQFFYKVELMLGVLETVLKEVIKCTHLNGTA